MPERREVLLLGGHESPAGSGTLDLRRLDAAVHGDVRSVTVPMTLGRDPEPAIVAAQTLGWAARGRAPGDLLLARPLGTTEHLIGWLRALVSRASRGGSRRQAVLLVAPAAGPEPDAELFRVARLVWQYMPVRWVEVALTGGEPDVDEGLERCRRLGADDFVLVPATLAPAPVRAGARSAGPLLGPAALTALIRERVAEAERRWDRYGDDGLSLAGHHHHHDGHHDDHHHGLRAVANLEGATSHVG